MSKLTNEYKVRCISLGGGVLKGVAYAGFFKALEANKLRDGVEYIIGSSTGALMAGIYAVGATPEHIKTLVLNEDGKGLDLTRVFTPGSPEQNILVKTALGVWNEIDHGGLCDGSYLHDYFVAQVKAACPHYEINSFKDLHDAREHELSTYGKTRLLKLYVTATNLNTSYREIFSYETTPNLSIADAVRASAAFKDVLTPVKIGDHLYGDGGFIYDIPAAEFDYARFYSAEYDQRDHPHQYSPIYNHRTLSCCFASAAEIAAFGTGKRPPAVIPEITNVIALKNAWIAAESNITYLDLPRQVGRTVMIDNLGITPTDTNMTLAIKQKLIQNAEDSTTKFIEGKRREHGVKPPLADLYEYKNSSDESRVNIGGINTSLPAARSSSFATQVNADKAKKKEQDSTCCIL